MSQITSSWDCAWLSKIFCLLLIRSSIVKVLRRFTISEVCFQCGEFPPALLNQFGQIKHFSRSSEANIFGLSLEVLAKKEGSPPKQSVRPRARLQVKLPSEPRRIPFPQPRTGIKTSETTCTTKISEMNPIKPGKTQRGTRDHNRNTLSLMQIKQIFPVTSEWRPADSQIGRRHVVFFSEIQMTRCALITNV